MTDVHQDVARTALSHPVRSKTHHGAGDRQLDDAAGSKLSQKEFVSVRLPELPGVVKERFNALKMTKGHGAFGPRMTMLDTMTMKQRLMEEHVQHLVDEYNNIKAAADSREKQLEVMCAQASSTSDVCGEITELSGNMEVYMNALQQRCDIVCTRLEDTYTHMECMRVNGERLQSSNRAVKVRTDAIRLEIAKGESKFKEARRLHHILGKASQAAQEEFQHVRSLLLAEADERQAQLDHRTSIWQFQQQQANDDLRARTAEDEARARAALTTASSVATANDDAPDAAVELEQMFVARAPLQEQLKWDKQQSNAVAAGMARLEVQFSCFCHYHQPTVSSQFYIRECLAAPGQTPSSSVMRPAGNGCSNSSSCAATSSQGILLLLLHFPEIIFTCAPGLRHLASDEATCKTS